MKAEITNNSRAPQGVHCVDGLKFVEPGQSRVLDVAEGYVSRVKALKFLDAKWGGAAEKSKDDIELKAVHRGGGSYSVMRGDVEVKEGMSKDDAKAFNDMSVADREAYVKA